MVKVILFILFMIPLSFLNFWVFQVSLFLIGLLMLMQPNFMFFYSSVSYFFGVDNLSYWMILLSIWICSLMVMASSKIYNYNNYPKMFNFNLMLMLLSLIMIFSSLNLFIFYVFFEISLLPLMVMILGWGYQPERLMAGMYLFFYTLMFSLPMMVGLFMINNSFMSFTFSEFYGLDSVVLYFLINMVFLVKIPMFILHLWLPKAHVEAPVSGSMILAGLMLKLGGYGMMRLMKLFTKTGLMINTYIVGLSLLGGVIISFICLWQTDMKSLIAYSSVSHMSMVLGGIMTVSMLGFTGSLVMMIAHGLCSSGLFCMANIYYERLNSRSLYMLKGLINLFPSLSLWMFLFSINNMSAPPSLNLMGEIFLLNSIMAYSSYFIMLLMLMLFFGGVYSIYLYSYSNHGKLYSGVYSFNSGLNREYLLLFLHWLPLNLLFLIGELYIIN